MCNAGCATDFIAFKRAASIDLAAPRKEYLFPLPRWASEVILSNLKDARDMPVATLYINIILVVVPAITLLYTAPACHIYGAVYLVSLYALFLARFVVALLHVTEHRPIFRQGQSQKSHHRLGSHCLPMCIQMMFAHLQISCAELCIAVTPPQAALRLTL